ncbi:MAG: hypothetical protein QW478_12750 [Candidatus Micrarchaeaceae archaeon]
MGIFGLFPKRLYSTVENGNRLEIFDNGKERIFKFNGLTYSKISKNSIFTHQYWDYFLPAAYVFQNPRILLIGLGAGTIPYALQSLLGNGANITAVESSEKTIEIAKRFVSEKRLPNIVLADGADYIKHSAISGLDIIMLDAYINYEIPKQFISSGFVQDAYSALYSKGLLLVNFAVGFMGTLAYAKYVALLKSAFNVYRISTAITESNVIILCSKSLDKSEINARIASRMPANNDMLHLLSNYQNMVPE